MSIRRGWMLRTAGAAAALLALTAFAACNGDDDDNGNGDAEAEVEATIRAAVEAWNAQNTDAFFAFYTDSGILDVLDDAEDQSDEGLREAFENFSGDDGLELVEIYEIDVDSDTATAEYGLTFTQREGDQPPTRIIVGVQDSLVREDGTWRIDAIDYIDPRVPDGIDTINVQANEFAFSITEETTSGNIAFEVENVGDQPHHVVLELVPDDFDVEAALQSPDEPEGLVHIGGTPPWDGGETRIVTFTEPLPAGRYVMLCFMPDIDDPEGTPHALKGMWKDFTIE